MAKKGKVKKNLPASLLEHFSSDALAEAEEFLARIEKRRQTYEPRHAELSLLCQRLIDRIKAAFAGVTCYRETRMLIGGEAEDEYQSLAQQ